MMSTIWGVVENGKIIPLEKVEIPDGTKVLVTVPSSDEKQFWADASQPALEAVWNNTEDDVYAELL